MAMLAHEVDVVEMSEDSLQFKYQDKIYDIKNQDVHAMDKEFLNG